MSIARGIFVIVLALALPGCKPSAEKAAKSAAAAHERSRKELFAWNLARTVGEYEKHGHRNAAWDGYAGEALELYARARSEEPEGSAASEELIRALRQAIDARCDDPLINWLHVRYSIGLPANPSTDDAKAFRDAADQLAASGYPAIRKFYANFRAATVSKYIDGKTPNEFHFYRRQTPMFLGLVLQDDSTPMEEIYEAFKYVIDARFWPARAIDPLSQVVDGIFSEARVKSALSYLIKAEHEIEYGWLIRGGGFADTVSEEAWKGFSEHLNKADEALEKAWKLDQTDPRIPTKMLTVVRANGANRRTMEKWFQRAMNLSPENYDACFAKLTYLQPKWHGSAEDMLAFGRECLQSTSWKGAVPLILPDAHYALSLYLEKGEPRAAYWKRPEVWPDIKASFDKFFAQNPEAHGWRHNYARFAWWCGEWDEFNKQLPFFLHTNYAFFGGANEFERMVKLANERQAALVK